MDNEVKRELDRLFTGSTTDQISAHKAQLKTDIASTQDQLRSLVGKRYKELLACCDMIVGMRSVCGELTSLAAMSPQKRLHANERSAGAASSEPRANGPEGAEVAAVLHRVHSVYVLLDQDCFLEASLGYKQASQELMKLQETHVEIDGGSSCLDAASFAVHRLPTAIRKGISGAFLRFATEAAQQASASRGGNVSVAGLQDNVARHYGDVQASIEQLEGCTPSAALERTLNLHQELLHSIAAESHHPGASPATTAKATGHSFHDTCVQLAALAGYCFAHAAQCGEGGVNPSAPSTQAMTLDSMLALDTNDPDFLKTITFQVCGLRAFDTNAVSPMDGWAMSPPAATKVKVPQQQITALQSSLVEALAVVAKKFTRSDAIVSAESAVITVLERTAQATADGISFVDFEELKKQIQEVMNNRLLQLLEENLKAAVHLCSEVCENIVAHPQQGAPPPTGATASLLSTPEALAEIIRRKIDSTKRQRLAAGASSGAVSSSSAPISHTGTQQALQKQFSAAGKILSAIAVRLSPTAIASMVSSIVRAVDNILQTFEKALSSLAAGSSTSHKEADARFAKVLNSVWIFVENLVTDVPSLSGNGSLVRMNSEIEAMYLRCQQQWFQECSEVLLQELSGLFSAALPVPSVAEDHQLLLSFYGDTWASSTVEGALIHYPANLTSVASRATLAVQKIIHERGSSAWRQCVLSNLSSTLRQGLDAFVVEQLIPRLPKELQGSVPEEVLMQFYFDLRVLYKAYADPFSPTTKASHHRQQGVGAGLDSFVRFLEQHVDDINWSVAYPLIESAATRTAEGLSLSLGFGGLIKGVVKQHTPSSAAASAQTGSEKEIKLLGEVPRFTLLPIESLTGAGGTDSLSGVAPGQQPSSFSGASASTAAAPQISSTAAEAIGTIGKGLRSAFGYL